MSLTLLFPFLLAMHIRVLVVSLPSLLLPFALRVVAGASPNRAVYSSGCSGCRATAR